MSTKRRTTLKVVLIGDSNCGKTSILTRYFKNSFDANYRATIGCDFFCKLIEVKDRVIQLQLWDTAGQERHRSLSRSFYRGADVGILVYDVHNPSSLKNLKAWKDEFLNATTENDPMLLVLGNKAEQPPIVQYSGDLHHFLVSAKTGMNVEQAFDDIAQFALTKDQVEDHTIDTKIVVGVPSTTTSSKNTCC